MPAFRARATPPGGRRSSRVRGFVVGVEQPERGGIRRAVVDDHNLEVRNALGERRLDGFDEEGAVVAARNHDRDAR
jgi:hypothetical protein